MFVRDSDIYWNRKKENEEWKRNRDRVKGKTRKRRGELDKETDAEGDRRIDKILSEIGKEILA